MHWFHRKRYLGPSSPTLTGCSLAEAPSQNLSAAFSRKLSLFMLHDTFKIISAQGCSSFHTATAQWRREGGGATALNYRPRAVHWYRGRGGLITVQNQEVADAEAFGRSSVTMALCDVPSVSGRCKALLVGTGLNWAGPVQKRVNALFHAQTVSWGLLIETRHELDWPPGD